MDSEHGFFSSNANKASDAPKTLRSVTAKQISSTNQNEVDQNVFYIDNVRVSSIEMVGFVKSVKKTGTGTVFVLDDTTGEIDCAFWANTKYEESLVDAIEVNHLVRIVGSIKFYVSKRNVSVVSVALADGNYFLYHCFSCIVQHNYYTGNEKRKNVLPSSNPNINSSVSSYSRLESDIMKVFENNQGDEGLELETVVAMLGKQYSEAKVREAIDLLQAECHLYCIDGTTYKKTM